MLNYNKHEVDYELSIGTKIGDLEWPWMAKWPLLHYFFVILNHGRAVLR